MQQRQVESSVSRIYSIETLQNTLANPLQVLREITHKFYIRLRTFKLNFQIEYELNEDIGVLRANIVKTVSPTRKAVLLIVISEMRSR